MFWEAVLKGVSGTGSTQDIETDDGGEADMEQRKREGGSEKRVECFKQLIPHFSPVGAQWEKQQFLHSRLIFYIKTLRFSLKHYIKGPSTPN